METSSTSSSDEECWELEFWDNWSPNDVLKNNFSVESRCTKKNFTENVISDTSIKTSILSFEEKSKFGNWIPPLIFLNDESKAKLISKIRQKQVWEETKTLSLTQRNQERKNEIQQILDKSKNHSLSVVWKKNINPDWGEKVHLYDVTKFNDGDTIWGLVNPGLFANIKLWVNQYSSICGVADGKISKINSSEMTYICIKNAYLLRKMLDLSVTQWASLCETVQETKTVLKFDAFENVEMSKKSHLEKLWFFACKRRHFLPHQCMLVKLSGARKCMKQFQIIPKLLVLDIRNLLGEPIL